MSNGSFTSNISHPLLLACPGTSQQGKILEELNPENIKIDAQEAEDLLNFIYQFSSQINFYDENLQQYNWQPFFEDSLPFVLARINKTDTEKLKADYDKLITFVKTGYGSPSTYDPQSLQLVFDFLYDEIFIPLTKWQKQFSKHKSSFSDVISATIRKNLRTSLKNYIALFNGAAFIDGLNTDDDYGISLRNFSELDAEKVWGLRPEDLTATSIKFYSNSPIPDEILNPIPSDFLLNEQVDNILDGIGVNLNTIVTKAINVFKLLGQKAPYYIKESLIPKYEEQRQVHLPQLGLLYTFMELSKHFRADINELSTKHLDFFYKHVLNIKEQPETPDKAHLVFELQKHVNQLELKAGTLIKDGKDANNKDVFFQVDEDIIVDKAQIAHLKTLHVNYVDAVIEDGDGECTELTEESICPYVEGVYIAPVAKAANGVKETAPPPSWPTLGAKFSKETIGDNELPERYPKADMGFVLASPVLYLQEGKRKINIRLCCQINEIEGVKQPDIQDFAELEMANLNETYYSLTESVINDLEEQLELHVKSQIEIWWTSQDDLSQFSTELLFKDILNTLLGEEPENVIDAFFDPWKENLINNLNDTLGGFDVCPIPQDLLNAYLSSDLDVNSILQITPAQAAGEVTTVTYNGVEEEVNDGGTVNDTEDDSVIVNTSLSGPVNLSIEHVKFVKQFMEKSIEYFETSVKRLLAEIADVQKIFNIYLSGEKEWINVKSEQIKEIDLKFFGSVTTTNNNNNEDNSSEEILPEPIPFSCPPGTDYELCIEIDLDESVAPVTFFNEGTLKESLGTTHPVAKILINGDIKIPIDSCEYIPCCSLENCEEEKELTASFYHYFRHFKVLDSCIEVEVCGLKNFIVQNDENLQNVNSPIYPFGVRPEIIDFDVVNPAEDMSTITIDPNANLIGPSFYVGSKEIFCKNWEKVWLNLEWKSKPSDFNEYYQAYNVGVDALGNPTYGLNEDDFEINISVLDDGEWMREQSMTEMDNTIRTTNYSLKDEDEDFLGDLNATTNHYNRALFKDNRNGYNLSINEPINGITYESDGFKPPSCIDFLDETLTGNDAMDYTDTVQQVIEVNSKYFDIEHQFRKIDPTISEYKTDLLNGFLKITLENQDFLHKHYAFILARQMTALARYPEAFPTAIYIDTGNGGVFDFGNIAGGVNGIDGFADDIITKVTAINNIIDDINDFLFVGNNSVKNRLSGIKLDINGIILDVQGVYDKLFLASTGVFDLINIDLKDCLFITGSNSNSVEEIINTAINEITGNTGDPALTLGSATEKLLGTGVYAGNGALNIIDNILDVLDISPGGQADLEKDIDQIKTDLNDVVGEIDVIVDILCDTGNPNNPNTVQGKISELSQCINDNPNIPDPESVLQLANSIKNELQSISIINPATGQLSADIEVPIPSEPWTPIIKEMYLDYTAKATKEDIDLIHIYPFENTYKEEPLNPQPMLLPTFVDEGTLFIGIKNLKPGSSLNLLFQLAEATTNTECDKADIKWHYLKNNRWNNPLRNGFEVAQDGTNGLTRSGIVKISVPEDISNEGYTIMPNPEPKKEPISWLKVSARKDIAAICETVGVYTQAVIASFKNDGNTREEMILPPNSLARLVKANSSIKKVNQYYDTFGGRLAEVSNNFYHRVSERLRHKGRGIQLFDYERLVLQHFPKILMARCVTHTFGLSAKKYRADLALAPGFVMLAVIPNLKLLSSGNALEPRVSTSLLDDIHTMLAKRISPFVRLKIVNPRYEKVDIQVKVKFKERITNVAFYKAKLEDELTQFMAPWVQGNNLDRLVFGRNLSASELVHFIECQPYIDFICSFDMEHEKDKITCYNEDENNGTEIKTLIEPLTARSILTVGTITVEHESNECDAFPITGQYVCNNITTMKN